jgi:hypothetical protein
MSESPSEQPHHTPGSTPNGSEEDRKTPAGLIVDEHGKPFPLSTGYTKDTGQEILHRIKMGELWMIILTAVVALATLGQFLLAYCNGKSTTNQTNALISAANRNADSADSFAKSADAINVGIGQSVQKLDAQAQEMKKAAVSAATTAEESLHVSERAYVVADLKDLGWDQCMRTNTQAFYCAGIHYRNIGRTPAISVVVTGEMIYDWKGHTPLDHYAIPYYDGLTGRSLANDTEGDSQLLWTKKETGYWMGTKGLMQQGYNGAFYLYGYIQYKDIFGDSHITAFCNYHPLNPSPQDHLPSQCPRGNWFEKDPALLKKRSQ